MRIYCSAFVLLVFILVFSNPTAAQKEYDFGAPGSECFLRYLIDDVPGSLSKTKPIIVIIGEAGQNPNDIHSSKPFASSPYFDRFQKVYIPNLGSEAQKNSCYDAFFRLIMGSSSARNKDAFLICSNTNTLRSFEDSDQNILKYFRNQYLTANLGNIDLALLEGKFPIEIIEADTKQNHAYFGPATQFGFTLAGSVFDEQTREALPFANISLRNGRGATTNMDGLFVLNNCPSDTATLFITYLGYQPSTFQLNPNMDLANIEIGIKPTSFSIDEAVVETDSDNILQLNSKQISTLKMTPKNLSTLPSLGERDILRSFQLMPGVSASNESSSGLYVRGGTPDQNLILYDGYTIYHVDHLYGFFSAFNANAIKDVQLYKGGFEAKYGGRLSSITEITAKDGSSSELNFGGEISMLSMNGFAEIPIGEKVTSLFTFRRSYKGFIYNEIFDQFNEDNSQTIPSNGRFTPQETELSSYFYDMNFKLTYQPTKKDKISFSFFNSKDNLDNGFELETPQRLADLGVDFNMKINDLTEYGNTAFGLRWARKWSPKIYTNTTLSYSNYFSERELSREGGITTPDGSTTSIGNGTTEDNNLIDYSYKTDLEWNISSWAILKTGVFSSYYDIQYDYIQDDVNSILDKDDQGFVGGAYLQNEFALFKQKLRITPGIRMSYLDLNNKSYFEPRLSASYQLGKSLSILGAISKHYQFVNRIEREDITSGSRDFWIMSDGDGIPVSSSDQFILGLNYDREQWLFSVEGYLKELDGLSEYTLRFESSLQGIDYNENFFNGIGYSKGLEFLIQKKYGAFKGWVSYTLSETKNQFDIYGEDYFFARQDVTNEFKAVGIYSHKKWDFSATWIYGTGRPYTAPSGAYSLDLVDGTSQDYFSVSSKNALRLPNYHRLDISAKYRLFNGKPGVSTSPLEIGYISASIFNLYNRKNTWFKQFDIVEGSIIETSINYLGFMPNITLSLNFNK